MLPYGGRAARMGFGVPWGFRLGEATLDEAWRALDARRPEAAALIRSETASALAAHAVERVDAAAIRGRPWGDALGHAWDALEAAARGAPDPAYDFAFKVVLCPHGGRVYAAGILGRRAYGSWLGGLPGAERFEFDGGDPPGDVPLREWRERERTWRAIVDGRWRLSLCGTVVEFADAGEPVGDAEVAGAAPARGPRVERAARHAALEDRTLATGNTVRAAVMAADWLATREGAESLAAWTARAADALPEITSRTLRGHA
jgi:hypothetical protein